MRVEIRERPERILVYPKKPDSAGRTPEQVDAMSQNEMRPPKLREADRLRAAIVAEEQAVYPKVMYRLALIDGKPAGDEINPSYPLPVDLAHEAGIDVSQFKVKGKTLQDPGHLVLRHPYETCTVGAPNDDDSVDVDGAREQEAGLRLQGWVTNINEIKAHFPGPSAGKRQFDPLPYDYPGKPEQPAKAKGR